MFDILSPLSATVAVRPVGDKHVGSPPPPLTHTHLHGPCLQGGVEAAHNAVKDGKAQAMCVCVLRRGLQTCACAHVETEEGVGSGVRVMTEGGGGRSRPQHATRPMRKNKEACIRCTPLAWMKRWLVPAIKPLIFFCI